MSEPFHLPRRAVDKPYGPQYQLADWTMPAASQDQTHVEAVMREGGFPKAVIGPDGRTAWLNPWGRRWRRWS